MKFKFKNPIWFRVGLISIFFLIGSVALAQNPNQKITINIQNVSIKEFIKLIESKTSYTAVYRDVLIDEKKDISITVVDKTLSEILKEVFAQKGLQAVFNNNTIVITKKKAEPQVTNKTKKVSGVVLDEKSEPVIGASVIIPGTSIGVSTDIIGRFALEAPSNAKLRISYIGYETKEEDINVSSDLKIMLHPSQKVLSEIVVTAQVRGQIRVIKQQLNSNEIMNAVSAERIQELPDANAAETVARLPGVSLQREGGEGSKLIIRGLEPKYNRITIDGVSMASTGGDDRSIDISMISPYSLDGIEVTKAITADKDANYMGGSVNFKLRKADPGFKSNIIVQGGYNNLRNTYNNFMIVGIVGNRFFHDKLGMYLQANAEKKNLSSNDLNSSIGFFSTPELNQVNPLTTSGLTMVDNYRNRNRYGATLVLDYKLPQGGIQFNNILSQSITSTNAFSEMYTSARTHEYNTGESKNNLLTVTNVLYYMQHFGKFEVTAKVSHSLSNNSTPKAIDFHYSQGGALSSDVFSKPISPEEIMNYVTIKDNEAYLSSISNGSGLSKQSQLESDFNLKYNFEITKRITGNLKGGLKFKHISNDYDYNIYSGVMNVGSGIQGKNAILNAFPWMQETVPLGSSQLPYSLFENKNANKDLFLNGKYHMNSYGDIALMNSVLNVLVESTKTQTGIDTYHYNDYLSTTSDYNGNESLFASYLMSEIKFGDKLTFIPGVRFERNVTQYIAPRGDSSLPFPDTKYVMTETTTNISDQFLLPMIHLKYAPFKWFNVRLAYTQTLSRPNFTAITPRWDIGSTNIFWNNYTLKPEQSSNFDAYFSFWDSKLGLLTIGGFTKDISNKIFSMDKRVILNASDYGLPASTEGKFIFTQMNNSNISKVRGLELDWQTAFWYLPGALKGLVLNVNYTWIYSEAKYPRTIIESTWNPDIFEYTFKNIDDYYTAPLIFQPKDILNLSMGYDYKKFSARISMMYTNKVFQGPSFWPELVNYSDEYVRWDISIKQGLPWFGGLQLFCNLNNITNAMDVLRNVGSGYTSSIQQYGRTVDVGLRLNIDQTK